ncbi:restriction endonuclease subunit S [Priestia sp. D3YE.R1]|uniref:restriction endonuclease subunit S n=1 Tax=Priestia sp. D3YE.R1 TaxID=3400416 RepID=UPI003BA08545
MNGLMTFELLKSKEILYIKGRIGWKGLKKEEFTETGPFLITGMHFKENGKIDWDRCFHIPQHRYDESPEIMLELEDILLTKDGTIGKVAFIDELPGPSSLNSHLLVLRVEDKKRIYPKYIFYSLQSDKFKKYIEKNKSGSTIVGLSQKAFENFEFDLPDYRVQQKIGHILSTVDEQIENVDHLIVKTKEFKKGLIQKLFTKGLEHTEFKSTDIGEIPVEWEVKKFIEITDVLKCGVASTPQYVDEGIPFLSSQNVKENKLILDKYNFISKEYHEELTKKHKPTRGDILYTRVGANFGKATIVNVDWEFSVYVSLTLIKMKKGYDSLFYSYLLNSEKYQRIAKSKVFQGGGVPNLNVGEVEKFDMIVPSLEEQQKIAEILSSVDEQIESYEEEKEKYIELKKGLMQQLLTGKLRVTV